MLNVIVNPYKRSVKINDVEVHQQVVPFPDYLNHLATIGCDYDENINTVVKVKGIHRYNSHMIEKEYYFKYLPAFIEWFYIEQQAQLDLPIPVNSIQVNSNTPIDSDGSGLIHLTNIVEGISINNDPVISPNTNGIVHLDFTEDSYLDLTNSSYNYVKVIEHTVDADSMEEITVLIDKNKRYEIILKGTLLNDEIITLNLVDDNLLDAHSDVFYDIEFSVTNQIDTTATVMLSFNNTNLPSIFIEKGNSFDLILRKSNINDGNTIDLSPTWNLYDYVGSSSHNWTVLVNSVNSFSEIIQGFEGYTFVSTSNSFDSGTIRLIRGFHPKPCSFKVRLINRHASSLQWPIDVGIVNMNGNANLHTLFSVNVPYYGIVEYTINCKFDASGNEVWSWYKNEINTNTSLPDATALQAGVVMYDNSTIKKNSLGQLTADLSALSEKTMPDDVTIRFNDNNKLKIVPYNTVQEFGNVNTITLSINTETSVSVKPAVNLIVHIDKLASNIDKLSTLVIIPTAATSVTWLFNNVAANIIWTSQDTIETVLPDTVAIVNIWQNSSGCLLSLVYLGTYNA